MQTMYTLHSLAKVLQVSTRTLRREMEENKLPFVRIRGRLRFRHQDVQDYLDRCCGFEHDSGRVLMARASEGL